jgi:CheY-like chemotaxis protein
LLVEDNADNSKLAVQILRKYGYECDLAVNGEEAVRALSEKQYPLVLMDCQMAVMDGFQATAAIREMEGSSRHTPILAMTAHSMQGDRERCLAAGMDDYLSKPLLPEKLVAMVQHWVSQLPAETGEPVRVRISSEIKSLIPAYLSNRRKDIIALSSALESNDIPAIGVIGHDMKGSGAGYGLPRLTEIGRDLEQAAKQGNLSGIRELAHAFADYMERLEVVDE